MMYFLLILFFSSLLGITFMIGRKLIMLQNVHVLNKKGDVLKALYLEEWKYLAIKGIKKHSYNGLVLIIKFYVQSTDFFKNKYQNIKDRYLTKLNDDSPDKREISKFLKIISEYKHKIKEIKHKIKEEERN